MTDFSQNAEANAALDSRVSPDHQPAAELPDPLTTARHAMEVAFRRFRKTGASEEFIACYNAMRSYGEVMYLAHMAKLNADYGK